MTDFTEGQRVKIVNLDLTPRLKLPNTPEVCYTGTIFKAHPDTTPLMYGINLDNGSHILIAESFIQAE